MTTDEFLVILQSYGYSVVPLTAWNTGDIVRMIELMDAELQSRAYQEGSYEPAPCCGEEWTDGSFGHE